MRSLRSRIRAVSLGSDSASEPETAAKSPGDPAAALAGLAAANDSEKDSAQQPRADGLPKGSVAGVGRDGAAFGDSKGAAWHAGDRSESAEDDVDDEEEEGDKSLWQVSPVNSIKEGFFEGGNEDEARESSSIEAGEVGPKAPAPPSGPGSGGGDVAGAGDSEGSCEADDEGGSASEGGGSAVADADADAAAAANSAVPAVVQLPGEMWEEIMDTATRCWTESCASAKSIGPREFEEVALLVGCMPLGPRNDPDVAIGQLMKDIKRETVRVNDKVFVGASGFEPLYSALEGIILGHSAGLSGQALEHKVQRILRGCSRTVSGYDAYDVVSALMSRAVAPRALVTPAMMNNSPIRIEHEAGSGLLVLASVNVFKISRELADGSMATVVVFKTEVTEQIELDSWSTVRWMSLKPLDRAEECLNPLIVFRERTLGLLLEQSRAVSPTKGAGGAAAALEHTKSVFEVLSGTRESLDQAIESSLKSVRELAEAEFLRGYQAALAGLASGAPH